MTQPDSNIADSSAEATATDAAFDSTSDGDDASASDAAEVGVTVLLPSIARANDFCGVSVTRDSLAWAINEGTEHAVWAARIGVGGEVSAVTRITPPGITATVCVAKRSLTSVGARLALAWSSREPGATDWRVDFALFDAPGRPVTRLESPAPRALDFVTQSITHLRVQPIGDAQSVSLSYETGPHALVLAEYAVDGSNALPSRVQTVALPLEGGTIAHGPVAVPVGNDYVVAYLSTVVDPSGPSTWSLIVRRYNNGWIGPAARLASRAGALVGLAARSTAGDIDVILTGGRGMNFAQRYAYRRDGDTIRAVAAVDSIGDAPFDVDLAPTGTLAWAAYGDDVQRGARVVHMSPGAASDALACRIRTEPGESASQSITHIAHWTDGTERFIAGIEHPAFANPDQRRSLFAVRLPSTGCL
jgi:hypothetical protein